MMVCAIGLDALDAGIIKMNISGKRVDHFNE